MAAERRVSVFRLQLFKPSETFIAEQAAALPGIRPLLVGRRLFGPPDPRLQHWCPERGALPTASYLATGLPDLFVARLRELDPSVVHAHFAVDGLYALAAARRVRRPLVTTLHGFDVTTRPADFIRSGRPALVRYALRRAQLQRHGDMFICVSAFMREQALRHGFPQARLVVHYIGIDPSKFVSATHEGPPEIVHVARLVPKKGTQDLIAAFGRIAARHPEATLTIIGEGPLRSALAGSCAGQPWGDRVKFLGALPYAEVRRRLAGASVLVLPSVTAPNGDAEGLGMVLLEAAASGLPVVGTRHGGIPEAVVDGETGLLVPERRPDLIAEALDALLRTPALRQRMGAAGRRMVEQRFDIRRQGAELERLYGGLA